jgi:peptidyl-prolyl cis-trans isomerase D
VIWELAKIISGENIQNGIDPLTRQVFTDPQTGQFNPQYAVNFFTQANQTPEGMQVAAFLEQELKDNRKYTKYTNLISQGLNITSLEAEKLYFERVEMTDFDYSVKKYNSIPDSTITVSEKELKISMMIIKRNMSKTLQEILPILFLM